jgi:hypothetical protein
MGRIRRAMATTAGCTILATAGLVALPVQAASAAVPCGSAAVARTNSTYAWGSLVHQGPLCGRNVARILRKVGGTVYGYNGPIAATSTITRSNGTNAGNSWAFGLQGGSLGAYWGCPINYICFNDGTRYPA